MRGLLASIFFIFENRQFQIFHSAIKQLSISAQAKIAPLPKDKTRKKNKKVKRQILKGTAPDGTDTRHIKRKRPLKKAPKTQW